MSAHADPTRPDDPSVDRWYAQADSNSAATRAAAYRQLARARARDAGGRLHARLDGLTLVDAEAGALLELFEAHPHPKASSATSAWLLREFGGGAPLGRELDPRLLGPEGVAALERGVRIVAKSSAAHPLLAVLATHPAQLVSRPAASALIAADDLEAGRYVDHFLLMLESPDPQIQDRAPALLAASGAARAIEPLIAAAEAYVKSHPSTKDAPVHSAALRTLSQERLGDRPSAWRAWWNARTH